jgi:hypothetical protein
MRIQIDQSGKLEDTNRPTVVGYSNGDNKTVIMSANEKKKLQKYFRNINKPKMYIYTTFSILIYTLIHRKKKISEVIIDREYPGQEALIKNLLLTRLFKSKCELDKQSISFDEIGKSANVHAIVWKSYRAKKADSKLVAKDIIKLIEQ